MGKKTKQGKSRKDKYYYLAKETGYRARSAFKLIQLNRRFNFLGSSRVLIDLCAAPGGWMQVAAKEMPVGSVIVGVDLVPIMPIPNCKTIIADITTDRCRQLLKAAVLHNKADIVLHDGAPNVGTAWTVDEYTQATLCLKAFALATEFLKKGGWFVTKVFRSRDYEPLKWSVAQFFRKIRVLKPEASRQESAEIFLIGQGYLDPSFIDPKFLDPRHVFGEVEVPKSRETVVSSLLRHTTKNKKAEGYDDEKLYNETLLSEFLQTDDPLKCLAKANKIVVDREDLMGHALTRSFIRESLSDIQVLGKAEIRALLSWRRKLLAAFEANKKNDLESGEKVPETAEPVEPNSDEEEEETRNEVERLLKEEHHTTKKRLKTIRKAKRKLAERVVLKMEHPGDVIEQNASGELFSLAAIGGRDLEAIEREEARLIERTGGLSAADMLALNESRAAKNEILRKRADDFKRAVEGGEYLQFQRGQEHDPDLGTLESTRPTNAHLRDDLYLSSSDDEDGDNLVLGSDDDGSDRDVHVDTPDEDSSQISGDSDLDDDEEESADEAVADVYAKALAATRSELAKTSGKKKASLLTDLDDADMEVKQKRKIDAWCESSELKQLMGVDADEEEEEEDEEKVKKPSIKKPRVSFAAEEEDASEEEEGTPDSSSSDDEALGDGQSRLTKRQKKLRRLRRPLTAEEKVLATQLIQSTKSRRDLLEWNFHKYRFFEDGDQLPDWFADDEKRHMHKDPPVENTELLNNRPIQGKTLKKAEEAKARKKMRMAKKLSSVRRRAENLPDDLTERETWGKIKSMYKNAGLLNKKRRPIQYVVNSKAGNRNKSQTPQRGAKIKLVDRRLKSDLRGQSRGGASGGRRGGRGASGKRGGRGGGASGKRGGGASGKRGGGASGKRGGRGGRH